MLRCPPLGLHLCSRSTRWGPARGRSGCLCPGPCALGSGEKQGRPPGSAWAGRRGVSRQGPCLRAWPPRGANAVERGVRRLECMTERTDRRRRGRRPALPPPRAAESGVLAGGSARAPGSTLSALPCRRASCPALRPGRVSCLLPAAALDVAVVPGWTLEGVLAELWGSRVPSHHGGRCSAGQGAPEGVSLETPHPGPGGSEARPWAACWPAAHSREPGCPHLRAWREPHLVCGPHRRSSARGEFLPGAGGVAKAGDPWLRAPLPGSPPLVQPVLKPCPRSPSARAAETAGGGGPTQTH